MICVSAARASVSPPRWGVLAGFRPNSAIFGTAKSVEGPARCAYDLSSLKRWTLLKSGFRDGWT